MTAVEQLGGGDHLSGDGGDAVLIAPPAYLADLARRGERNELRRHADGWARLRHRPVHRLVTVATRLARTTHAQALEGYAHSLEQTRSLEQHSAGPTGQRRWEDLIGWAQKPTCPHWFTPHARHLAAAALRTAADVGADDRVAPGDAASLAAVQTRPTDAPIASTLLSPQPMASSYTRRTSTTPWSPHASRYPPQTGPARGRPSRYCAPR